MSESIHIQMEQDLRWGLWTDVVAKSSLLRSAQKKNKNFSRKHIWPSGV